MVPQPHRLMLRSSIGSSSFFIVSRETFRCRPEFGVPVGTTAWLVFILFLFWGEQPHRVYVRGSRGHLSKMAQVPFR